MAGKRTENDKWVNINQQALMLTQIPVGSFKSLGKIYTFNYRINTAILNPCVCLYPRIFEIIFCCPSAKVNIEK